MRPAPSLFRTVALVVGTLILASCTVTPTRPAASGHRPTLAAVVRGHYVTPVELDGGDLVVTPPGKARARLSAARAEALFRAADVVDGSYRFAVLGLGRVTVSTEVSTTTDGTTSTGPGTTTTGAARTTTTTTGAARTTTTGAAEHAVDGATSSTAAPTTTAGSRSTTTTNANGESSTTSTPPPPAALPVYDNRLAWVGIAWGADCPTASAKGGTDTRYVAVVLDAQTGHSVLAYTSRSAPGCGGAVQPPSVSRPEEIVSVPWQPVGPASTAVRATIPACGSYFGWTDVTTQTSSALQVLARTPFDPRCPARADSTLVVDSVVPLGPTQAQLPHAALGPVDGLRTLPGG